MVWTKWMNLQMFGDNWWSDSYCKEWQLMEMVGYHIKINGDIECKVGGMG